MSYTDFYVVQFNGVRYLFRLIDKNLKRTKKIDRDDCWIVLAHEKDKNFFKRLNNSIKAISDEIDEGIQRII